MIFIMDLLKTAKELSIKCDLKQAREISTFKGGGSAYVFQPENLCETIKIIAFLKEENTPFHMLGGGSNMLVFDGICKSVLISLKHLNDIHFKDDLLYCGAGTRLSDIIKIGREYCLGGLEFLSGVPCTLGGAIKMNAGAFNAQTCDYLYSIDTLNIDCVNCDKIFNLTNDDDCKDFIQSKIVDYSLFSYRQGIDGVILSCALKLANIDAMQSIEKSKEYLRLRREKQPLFPSIGCTFKNGEIPSGKLIESCHLKGTKIGGAQISDKHANFIVNTGNASSNDYLNLAALAKKRVFEEYGILLKEEFCLVT